MSHVMLDLETMGTDPYSPVVAIGACRFEMNNDTEFAPEDMFYQPITLESCMELGLKPSASTITWWLAQSREAIDATFAPKDVPAVALPIALDAFTDWLNSRPDTIWGNSAAFDCGLLAAAYKACGKVVPWEFYREACYRTVKNLPGAKEVPMLRVGVHHKALDDAISQANHLRAIFKHLKL